MEHKGVSSHFYSFQFVKPGGEGGLREVFFQLGKDAGPDGGPEIIIESSGSNSALATAVKALKPTGRVVAISWYNGAMVDVPMNTLIVKNADLIGTLASPNSFGPVLSYMASGKLNVKPLITHIKPLEELPDVVKMVRAKKEMRIKILLKP